MYRPDTVQKYAIMPCQAEYAPTIHPRDVEAGEGIVSASMNPDPHIPVQLIWEYSQNPSALVSTQLVHLDQCGHCIVIFELSQLSKSFQELKQEMTRAHYTKDAAVITTVATWSCECGASIKAIGETDRSGPETKIVATCPNCGENQDIYAHRIISVTCEKAPTPTMSSLSFPPCEERLHAE